MVCPKLVARILDREVDDDVREKMIGRFVDRPAVVTIIARHRHGGRQAHRICAG